MQPLNDTCTPATVALENDLRIGACPERRSLLSELMAQLNKIVNFTIENDHITSVSALHWLIARREVDD